MLPKHLKAIVSKPRTVKCLVCGVSCEITGSATKKLCAKHRKERDADKTKWNQIHGKRKTTKVRNLQAVRESLHPPAISKIEAVSPPLRFPPAATGEPEKESLATKAVEGGAYRLGTFQEAIQVITEPERKREGFRHGWLGTTGSGKTTSLKTFLRELERDRVLTLIHDDTKLDAQYAGSVCHSVRDAPDDATTLVFRGDVFKGTIVQPEYVAALAIEIAKTTREPVRVLVDEITRACSRGGMVLQSRSVHTILTQGRALGVSLLWSNQSPIVPKELIDQSSTIAIGQLGPRALNYLDERLKFDPELLNVVPDLKQGQFVLSEQGKRWNRTIYQTPAPDAQFDHARKGNDEP